MCFSTFMMHELRWDVPILKMENRTLVFQCGWCATHDKGNKNPIIYTQYGFPILTQEFLNSRKSRDWFHTCPTEVLDDWKDQHEKWRFRWAMRIVRIVACINCHANYFNEAELTDPTVIPEFRILMDRDEWKSTVHPLSFTAGLPAYTQSAKAKRDESPFIVWDNDRYQTPNFGV